MYAFIDDSGDTGFKFEKGSSPTLVIACCVFPDADSVERMADSIRELKAKCGWNQQTEFKFSKTRNDIRKKFLEAVSSGNFFIRATVFRKTRGEFDYSPTIHGHFMSFAIQSVLRDSVEVIHDASIQIDGSGSKAFKRAALNNIKKQVNEKNVGTIKKITFADSRNNQLIQLADMVAGSIRLAFSAQDAKATEFHNLLIPRLEHSHSRIDVK